MALSRQISSSDPCLLVEVDVDLDVVGGDVELVEFDAGSSYWTSPPTTH